MSSSDLIAAWILQRQGKKLTHEQKILLNEDQKYEEYPHFIKYDRQDFNLEDLLVGC